MKDLLLLSRDPATVAKYQKLAGRLGRRLVTRAAMNGPLPEHSVLADCDSVPADARERADLVALLCAHARKAPTACFGYHLNRLQMTTLEKAGVIVARGPGRILLRVLAMWEALRAVDVQPAAEPRPAG
jgi:hypothetical protein